MIEGVNQVTHGIDSVSFKISGDRGNNKQESNVVSIGIDSGESQSNTLGPTIGMQIKAIIGGQSREGGLYPLEMGARPFVNIVVGDQDKKGELYTIEEQDGLPVIEGTDGQVSKEGRPYFRLKLGHK